MTDKEAAAIRERWRWISRDLLPDASQAKADIRALLTERALRREIVWAVASATPHTRYTAWLTPPPLPSGVTIEGMVDHFIELDAEWRDKARALLAGEEGEQP